MERSILSFLVPRLAVLLAALLVVSLTVISPVSGEVEPVEISTGVEQASSDGSDDGKGKEVTRDRFGRTALHIGQEEALGSVEQLLPDEVISHPAYTDMWLERSAQDLRLFVGATDPAAVAGALAEWSLPIEIKVVQSKYSGSELERAQAAIDDTLDLVSSDERVASGQYWFSTYTDPMNDRIVIEVALEADELILSAALRHDRDRGIVEVVRTGEPPHKVGNLGDACTHHSLGRGCDTPLRGGVQLRRAGASAWCSSGFVVYLAANPSTEFTLTSGHCSGSWNEVVSTLDDSGNVVTIGNRRQSKNSGSVDALLVLLNGTHSPSNTVATYQTENYVIQGKIVRSQMPLNSTMRRGGKYSDTDGLLVSKGATQNGKKHQGKVEDAPACGGDSGGPWTYTNKAVGIHSASTPSTVCPAPASEVSHFTFVSKIFKWRKNAGQKIKIKKTP
ncbi:MAG: hypothetical protein V3V01_10860 [Acidimicrobiales bacterium]